MHKQLWEMLCPGLYRCTKLNEKIDEHGRYAGCPLSLEAKQFTEIIMYHDIFSDDMHISNAIPDDTTKSIISKENNSFHIFQDHFYNKLQRSKMILKYTDHLYDKQGNLTQAFVTQE